MMLIFLMKRVTVKYHTKKNQLICKQSSNRAKGGTLVKRNGTTRPSRVFVLFLSVRDVLANTVTG